ncbi:MAG: hypothetical protein VX265_07245 [Myxococcota bacterium]|nr:hypothetical protein [Myxococcota bacterium]MEC8424705.1 hypothetical protein [Myxococcota bacterium]
MRRTRLIACASLLIAGSILLITTARWRPAQAASLARRSLRVPVDAAARAGVVPGEETAELEHLHPDFRSKVARITSRLNAAGHTVRVASVYRSPERQDVIHAISRISEKLGGSPGTRVSGGQSCHNQQQDGIPASAAIDLRGARGLRRDQQAVFYKALGRAAAVEGLRWGGNWARRNPVWARYDLGWDPGHIEDARLCRRLRRAQ